MADHVNEEDFTEWWRQIREAATDRSEALHQAYQQFENAGLVNKVVVHRYLCRRHSCKLATVIRIGDLTLVRTEDNKLSPGLNLERTVEAARLKNTLDGDRHWPGHTFDVHDLAASGLGVDMSCRHGLRTVLATDAVAIVEGVKAGHPGAPTLL